MKDGSNVDTIEIDKFSAMANQWWDPTGPCEPLHVINPSRLQYICDRVELANKNVLDVGCGAGILTESLAANNAQATGIDAGTDVIAAAKAHARSKDLEINYHVTTIEDFSTSAQQFDIITCMELIEHVPDPQQLISACAAMLKPGGKLFLSTVNRTPKAYAYAILGAEYILNILPKQTHDYKKFIKPAELAAMLATANLQMLHLQGVKYQPFTKSANLCEDVSVNYIVCASKED